MKKVFGHRLMLVGFYLAVGLFLLIWGRTQDHGKSLDAMRKQATVDQQILSSFRIFVAHDVNDLAN
ncbi:hypothetical protein ACO2Q8_16015 [Larkinella sp. VNQ87]|uniref:hypothetical protein n=1 Tax=Larkinella sp. VNQ87 TaxID=3400921 RepID=UPI003C0D02FB